MLQASDCDPFERAFERDGFVRFPRVVEPVGLADGVWAHLAGRGIARDDPSTWPTGAVHHLDGVGRSPELARGCAAVLDTMLGCRRWHAPKRGGQVAVTFPQSGQWALPTKMWHTDARFTEPLEPLSGGLMLVFVDAVKPGGGGTAILAGSHRLIARFAASRPEVRTEKMATARKAFFRSHAWLTALVSDDAEPQARLARFGAEADIDGLPARVVEVTGEAGDIVFAHPLVAHCVTPNCGDRPRIMRILRPLVTANEN